MKVDSSSPWSNFFFFMHTVFFFFTPLNFLLILILGVLLFIYWWLSKGLLPWCRYVITLKLQGGLLQRVILFGLKVFLLACLSSSFVPFFLFAAMFFLTIFFSILLPFCRSVGVHWDASSLFKEKTQLVMARWRWFLCRCATWCFLLAHVLPKPEPDIFKALLAFLDLLLQLLETQNQSLG